MPHDPYELVAPAQRDGVRAALESVFGRAPVTALEPVSGGASGAAIFRVQAGAASALLRLDTARDAFRDPQRAYTCMRLAAAAGIAPALHYADPVAGIAIMDFVACRALSEYPHGPSALVRELGELIARLHALPLFPAFISFELVLDRMLLMITNSGLFSAGLLDAHRAGFERLRAAYPWSAAALVSSHNDLNPTNVLYDGERLWFVDWEIAYRNDPLLDVATAAETFAPTQELADTLLAAATGCKPDRALQARLVLMREFMRLYYACLMLSTCIGRRPMESELTALTLDELFAAHARGMLVVTSQESLHAGGKAFLSAFLRGLGSPECLHALAICEQA